MCFETTYLTVPIVGDGGPLWEPTKYRGSTAHVHLLLIHTVVSVATVQRYSIRQACRASPSMYMTTCALKLKEMTRYPRHKHYSALGECTLDAVKLEYLVAMFFCNI